MLNIFFVNLYNYSQKEPTRPALLHDQNVILNLPFSACSLLTQFVVVSRNELSFARRGTSGDVLVNELSLTEATVHVACSSS